MCDRPRESNVSIPGRVGPGLTPTPLTLSLCQQERIQMRYHPGPPSWRIVSRVRTLFKQQWGHSVHFIQISLVEWQAFSRWVPPFTPARPGTARPGYNHCGGQGRIVYAVTPCAPILRNYMCASPMTDWYALSTLLKLGTIWYNSIPR